MGLQASASQVTYELLTCVALLAWTCTAQAPHITVKKQSAPAHEENDLQQQRCVLPHLSVQHRHHVVVLGDRRLRRKEKKLRFSNVQRPGPLAAGCTMLCCQ